jgi:spermidine synthase
MTKTQTGGISVIGFYVYLVVIVSGAAVLALELLGTRLIAPFYGADIYLWSALISVTLAALSCGYALGGRFADRAPRPSRLALLVGLAGLWITIVPWLRVPMFSLAQLMDLRLGVLLIAFVLFFPPLTLLGMVSPYAIRLKASRVESIGTVAGNLYAVSTVASVVAALATGFILIPHVGVHRLVFVTGLLLIVTAGVGLIAHFKAKGIVASLLILAAAGGLLFGAAPSDAANVSAGLLAVESSAYADIRVVDQDSIRYLLIDGGLHSAIDLSTGLTHMPYVNVLDIVKRFTEKPGSVLTIGLGAGSVVKNFARDGWQVDAVEIDPVVAYTAEKFFGLTNADARIFGMDGRQFLMTHGEQYEAVVMDAYGSSYIPFHLVTHEAFELTRSRMKPNGMLAINVECVGWNDPLVGALARTLRRSFRHVEALPIVEPPSQFGNLVLLASDRSLDLPQDLPVPIDRFSLEYDQAHAWDNRFEPDSVGVPVLTDDFNPVDAWSGRINLAARQLFHTGLDVRGIAW